MKKVCRKSCGYGILFSYKNKVKVAHERLLEGQWKSNLTLQKTWCYPIAAFLHINLPMLVEIYKAF